MSDIYLGKNTLIMMADRTPKKISDIQIGDYIASCDDSCTVIIDIFKSYDKKILTIITEKGRMLQVSMGTSFDNYDHTVILKKLKAGQQLTTLEGKDTVIQCKIEDYDDDVYCFATSNDKHVIANDFLIK